MSLRLFVCAACGRTVFPRRLLCPDCGGTEWRREPVAAGVIEAATERDGIRIGAVRTPPGPLVVARLEDESRPGDDVSLDEDGNVPVARAGRELLAPDERGDSGRTKWKGQVA